ncbi:hypothetical protein RUND412_007692 [Rhizina undulata]
MTASVSSTQKITAEFKHDESVDVPSTGNANSPRLPPESIRHLSPAERLELELMLRKKIDWRLMPMLILMYVLNHLDRNSIAAARLAGLEADLSLVGTQYQTCVGILFVGYILMQIPSNMFLDKIGKPSIYLPTCMIIWGVVSGATGSVQNFGGLVACRLVLGFIEAAFFPGCLFYISSWYTRKELGFRSALLYSGSLLSGAFSGLITAGIIDGMDDARGIVSWRWLFIIEGSITVLTSCAAFYILPDFPNSTTWLSEQERDLAMWRLEEDIGERDWEAGEAEKLMHGLKLAMSDLKTWLLMLLVFCQIAAGSVANFFPTLVATLGYNRTISLLLTAPPYVLCVITAFANARHADKTGERYLHVTIPMWVALVAYIIAACTTATAPRYLSMMLMVPGIYTSYVVALAWCANTLPRPPAKRAAALAAINAAANTSQIYTAYFYPESQGPRYVMAMGINAGATIFSIIAATVLKIYLTKLNKRLDRGLPVRDVVAVPGNGAVGGHGAEEKRGGFRFFV